MFILKGFIYILIIFNTTAIGIAVGKKYSNRLNNLQEFKNAINMLETKIKYTYEPLSSIFKDISRIIGGKTGEIFSTASYYMENIDATTSWNKSIDESTIDILKEDKKVLKTLGKLLGKTNVEGQINQIELNLSLIEIQIKKAEKEKEKNERLWKTVGIVSGLGIVIILF